MGFINQILVVIPSMKASHKPSRMHDEFVIFYYRIYVQELYKFEPRRIKSDMNAKKITSTL